MIHENLVHPCANPDCKTCKGRGVLIKGPIFSNMFSIQQCPECIEPSYEKVHHTELGHGDA